MKIDKYLRHCYNTVPYYKKLFDENGIDMETFSPEEILRRLPLLPKDKIIKNTEDFLSVKYDQNKLIKEYTSGSTGEPAVIFKSYIDKVASGKALWKFRKKDFGIKPSDCYVKFHMSPENRVKYLENGLSFSLLRLNDEDIEEYYRLLNEYHVKWIFGAPSAILLIAQYIEKNALESPIDVSYIEVSGEFHTDAAKEKIEKVFGCRVGELYGLREVYGVAMACEYGEFHAVDENVIIHITDDDGNELPEGEEGNLLITSLNNTAMPFIKYLSGDRASKKKNVTCACGRCGDVIKIGSGRIADYIQLDDNRILSSCIFYLAVARINVILSNVITQFQVIAQSNDDYLLKAVLSGDRVLREEIEKMYLEFIEILGMPERNWQFEYVDFIELDQKTGQHRLRCGSYKIMFQ